MSNDKVLGLRGGALDSEGPRSNLGRVKITGGFTAVRESRPKFGATTQNDG